MGTEIVHIGFPYSARVLPVRKRSWETVYYRAVKPFAIETHDDKTAPLVALVGGEKKRHDSPPPALRPIRRVGNDFYRSIDVVGDGGQVDVAKFKLYAAAADRERKLLWQGNPFIEIAAPEKGEEDQYYSAAWLPELDQIENVKLRQVASNDQDMAEARMHAAMERFCIVDGVVFERCKEPVIGVFYNFGHYSCKVVMTDDKVDGQCIMAFRLDRMEDAESLMRKIAKADHADQDRMDKPAKVKVFLPHLLTRDDRLQSVTEAMDLLFGKCAEAVKSLDRAGILAFADLKDALEALKGEAADEATAKAFVAALMQMVRSAETVNATCEHEWRAPSENRELIEAAARYIWRWSEYEKGFVAQLAPDDEAAMAMIS